MGCPISKGSYQGKGYNGYFEYMPENDGKKVMKKKMQERTLSTRQSKIIRDPKLTSKYDIKSLIGVGTFSDVFFVVDKVTKYPYAIKVIELSCLKTQRVFQSESEALYKIQEASRISHPNLVKLKEIITCNFSAYIIMELATGGDLFERIQVSGHIKETESIRITKMLLQAVSYLHRHGITHRDLKPENVLFYTPGEDSRIIITDFGFASCRDPNSLLETYCGTLEYLSPEIILGKAYSNKVDIWAIGVIVYHMLSGTIPFYGRDVVSSYEEISKSQPSFKREVWQTISLKAKQFIQCALTKKEEQRFDAESALNHPWLKKTCRVKNTSHKNNSPINSCSTHSHGKKQEVVEFDELPTIEDVQPLKLQVFEQTMECRTSNTDKMECRTSNTDKETSDNTNNCNTTGICNKAYENSTKIITGPNFGDAYLNPEKVFVIPWKATYNKRISKEDLFADTNSSYSTYCETRQSEDVCSHNATPSQDALSYQETANNQRIQISPTERNIYKDNAFPNDTRNSKVVQLPSLFKRSLSSAPVLNLTPCSRLKKYSMPNINTPEQALDQNKLDALFSVRPRSTSPKPPQRINAWSNSQSNSVNKKSRVEEWLNHNENKTAGTDLGCLPYVKKHKYSEQRDRQTWMKLNEKMPSEALSKSL